MKGNIHLSIWASIFSFLPFDVLFRKNWLNAPTGTRTHVSWSLVRRDNHYTTRTRTHVSWSLVRRDNHYTTRTRTHVSWSLVRRDNHYTTRTRTHVSWSLVRRDNHYTTRTRTHVSWSLVRRDNHYTTRTHHAGNTASLEVQSYHRGWSLGPNFFFIRVRISA